MRDGWTRDWSVESLGMEIRNGFGIEREGAVGCVAIMLDWAAEQEIPDGDVSGGRWSAIARRCGYLTAEDAAKLFQMLVLRGQLDVDGIVADWPARAPDLVHARLARAGLKFKCGCSPLLRSLGKHARDELKRKGFTIAVCARHGGQPQITRRLPAALPSAVDGTVNTYIPVEASAGRPEPAGQGDCSLPGGTHARTDATHGTDRPGASEIPAAAAAPEGASTSAPVSRPATAPPPLPVDPALSAGASANLLYFDYRRDPVDLALELVSETDNDTTACFQRKVCNAIGQENYRRLLLKLHLDTRRKRSARNLGAILTVRSQRALEKVAGMSNQGAGRRGL